MRDDVHMAILRNLRIVHVDFFILKKKKKKKVHVDFYGVVKTIWLISMTNYYAHLLHKAKEIKRS